MRAGRSLASLARRNLERKTAELLGCLAGLEWVAGVLGVLVPGGRPITLMFTDIEGFTAYAAARGDGAAVELLRRHDDAVLPAIRRHRGRLVKRLGDGLMIAFPSPTEAVKAALVMQAGAARARVKLRIGIHTGEARSRDGDLIGHDVNIAARIADRAPAGHVLVSETVREAADGLRASVRKARPLVIAGAKPVPLFRVEAAR